MQKKQPIIVPAMVMVTVVVGDNMSKKVDFIRGHVNSNFGHSSEFWRNCLIDLLEEHDRLANALESVAKERDRWEGMARTHDSNLGEYVALARELSDKNVAMEAQLAAVTKERDKLLGALRKIARQPEDGGIDDTRTLGLIDDIIRTLEICRYCGGDVQFNVEHDNFYCESCRRGQGHKYYNKHNQNMESNDDN